MVGHFSDDLATIYTAGYLSKEDALKSAFNRSQAAENCKTGAS